MCYYISTWGNFWALDNAIVCICMCVSVCVCVNPELVSVIAHHHFKLGTPNWDQGCKHLDFDPCYLGVIQLELQGLVLLLFYFALKYLLSGLFPVGLSMAFVMFWIIGSYLTGSWNCVTLGHFGTNKACRQSLADANLGLLNQWQFRYNQQMVEEIKLFASHPSGQLATHS